MKSIRPPRRRHPDDPGGHGAPKSVLDESALARLRQLDPQGTRGFMVQVMRTYESSMVRHLAAMDDARQLGDIKRAGDLAHTLKSSSASVGALGFAACCAEVERLARQGLPEALAEPLVSLQSEGARVLVAVRAMLPA